MNEKLAAHPYALKHIQKNVKASLVHMGKRLIATDMPKVMDMTKKAEYMLEKLSGIKHERKLVSSEFTRNTTIGPGRTTLKRTLSRVVQGAKAKQRNAAKYLLGKKNLSKHYRGIEEMIDSPGVIQQAIKDILKAK